MIVTIIYFNKVGNFIFGKQSQHKIGGDDKHYIEAMIP